MTNPPTLREALEQIASQKIGAELDREDRDCADWQGGFEACVTAARAALSAQVPEDDLELCRQLRALWTEGPMRGFPVNPDGRKAADRIEALGSPVRS